MPQPLGSNVLLVTTNERDSRHLTNTPTAGCVLSYNSRCRVIRQPGKD